MFIIKVFSRTVKRLSADRRGSGSEESSSNARAPALFDGEQKYFESHAIAKYLVDKYAENDALFPKELILRTAIEERLSFETVLYNSLQGIFEPLQFGLLNEISDEKIKDVLLLYDTVESFFKSGNSYVAGNTLTIADLCFWSTLASFRYFVPIKESKYPLMSKWLQTMNSKSTYEINQSGADEHFQFIQRCMDRS